LGIATGLTGGIHNIQNVTGSQGNDLIVGNAASQVLSGGTGRNIIIAGASIAHVIGDGGDNILIDGTTIHDQNMVALKDFMVEWLRTLLSFNESVADIGTAGASVPRNNPPSGLKGTGYMLTPGAVHSRRATTSASCS
jgi:hypothetical protein